MTSADAFLTVALLTASLGWLTYALADLIDGLVRLRR